MEFEKDDEVCVLDCNHCYHTDCIAQWLKHSKVCSAQCSSSVCLLSTLAGWPSPVIIESYDMYKLVTYSTSDAMVTDSMVTAYSSLIALL